MKAYHVTSSMDFKIKKCYSQDEHCRLLLDHFGGRKVTLLLHLKAKLNRFSYSDGLLWHHLSSCDLFRIYVPLDIDLKLMILHECHDAPSSEHLGREKTFLRVSEQTEQDGAFGTKISGKEAGLSYLDHVYRLHRMLESIVSDRDPRFTSSFWRHVFEPMRSKLHMSTADHPQTDGQTERANRVVADVLRTVATPKEWSKQLPFVEFSFNKSVHASTGETPFYINGLRHPRTPVSFVRSPRLSGGGPLTSLGANAKEGHNCTSVTASSAVVTTPISVNEEARQEMPVILDDDTIVLSTASTHERPLGGVIGELDAKSMSD
ncbi:unnamed protein product [Peronospora effusa]|nr:unnamed protein product [Peronospora effusa]